MAQQGKLPQCKVLVKKVTKSDIIKYSNGLKPSVEKSLKRKCDDRSAGAEKHHKASGYVKNKDVKNKCVENNVDNPIAGPSGISLRNLRIPFGAPLTVQKVERGYIIYPEKKTAPVSTNYPPYYIISNERGLDSVKYPSDSEISQTKLNDQSNYNTDCESYSTYPKPQVIDVNESYEKFNSKILEYDSDSSEDSDEMERVINNAYQDSLTSINFEDEISFVEEVITVE